MPKARRIRQRMTAAAVATIALLLLAACDDEIIQTVVVTQVVETAPEIVTATPTPPAAQDTITICMSRQPDDLPGLMRTTPANGQVLTAADPKGWMPDRAYGYESLMLTELPTFDNGGATLDGDTLRVTFHFKPNITWSDGQPFTVDDVLFTRDVYADPAFGFAWPALPENLTLNKLDDHTLEAIYEVIYEGLPSQELIAHPEVTFLPPFTTVYGISAPLPRHALAGMTPTEIRDGDYARLPTPTLGPYELYKWVPDDHVTLRAVENWWGGPVKTRYVVYRFIPEPGGVLVAALSGACDYATADGFSLEDLPLILDYAGRGKVKFQVIPSPVWERIDMNTFPAEGAEAGGYPFFADVRVRQAVAYGTDRRRMVDEIFAGHSRVMHSYLPDDHWAFYPEAADAYPYDPDRARDLLRDAGWVDLDGDGLREAFSNLSGEFDCGRGMWNIPAGTPLEVDFHTAIGDPVREQLALIFRENMAEIGIKVNLAPLPADAWSGEGGLLARRTFQIGSVEALADPDPAAWSLFAGQNLYHTPGGDILAAEAILEGDPYVLSGAPMWEVDFVTGRPALSLLPEGYTLAAWEQVPSAQDAFEGLNYTGWCNAAATQAAFDAGRAIDPQARRLHTLELQRLLIQDVPSLPLFQRVEIEVYHPALCGPGRGPRQAASWNVETWYFSESGACE